MGLAPNSSSPSSNNRPTTGFTPSMGRKSVETNSARTCSASPAPVRLNEYPRETPIMENVVFCFRQSRKFGNEIDPASKFGLLSCSVTSCSGSGYGKGFSSTPFATENSAVFAPMPSASVRIATAANPGDFVIILTPNRKSCISRSSDPQPHVSRVTSCTSPTFPNSRRAARSASSIFSPRSARSCVDSFRWLRTSSSSSASRLFRRQKLTGRLQCFLTSALRYFLTSLRRYFSSGCSTPAIASESCDHFERSLVSCFFPAAVSW